ncbi:hypothetical protein HK100_007569 [Physocladia obscura]|uniref:Impact N-terminal domain-containing protein n=1 Tax=Physocladia obscura TaxID=109957 RepID=A0AAD5XI82_9FUNG|nr:hypothetical protein HK100_007569 [Physocladia obscura]
MSLCTTTLGVFVNVFLGPVLGSIPLCCSSDLKWRAYYLRGMGIAMSLWAVGLAVLAGLWKTDKMCPSWNFTYNGIPLEQYDNNDAQMIADDKNTICNHLLYYSILPPLVIAVIVAVIAFFTSASNLRAHERFESVRVRGAAGNTYIAIDTNSNPKEYAPLNTYQPKEMEDSDGYGWGDELVALQAIYGDALTTTPDHTQVQIRFGAMAVLEAWLDDADYPAVSPPEYRVVLARDVGWAAPDAKARLDTCLAALFLPGQPVLFAWIETLQAAELDQTYYKPQPHQNNPNNPNSQNNQNNQNNQIIRNSPSITIYSGDIFLDRKSRFQAHIAKVKSIDDVNWVVSQVKLLPKVALATHNMVAFRLASGDSNRDDDGEGGAGDRMLNLLERMGKTNLVAVVSRWYGGIQLGPDRFKDITGVLKKLLEKNAAEFS